MPVLYNFQVCELTSFLSLDEEVSPSSGPAECSDRKRQVIHTRN